MPIKETTYITSDEWAQISAEHPVRGMTGRKGTKDVDPSLIKKLKRVRNLPYSDSPLDQVARAALQGRPSVTTFEDDPLAGNEAYRFANSVRTRGEGDLRAISMVDPISGLPTVTVGHRTRIE